MTTEEIERNAAEIRRIAGPASPIGNWTDDPCYYVTVIDGPRWATLLGPFRTHEEALALVEKARTLATARDPFSHFYAFGTAKLPDGYRIGTLNREAEL